MKTVVKKIFAVVILSVVLIIPSSLKAQNDDQGAAPDPNQQQQATPPPPSDPAPQAQAADAPLTLQTFYDQLAPYGQWVSYGAYGYVFIPSVAPGFAPYATAGHWEYNDQFGWTWASDYPWGWATFHYGRWNFDPNMGWFWIPDLNWGPAWVAWRNCEGYYGWAPLPWGVTISVGFGDYGIAADYWNFVPQQRLCEINLFSFFVPRIHNLAFIRHSSIIGRMDYDNRHHFGYFKGPDRVEVEGYVHHPVRVVEVDRYRYRNDDHGRPVTPVGHDDHGRPVTPVGHDDHGRHDDHGHPAPPPARHDNNGGNDNHGHQEPTRPVTPVRTERPATPQRSVDYHNVPSRGNNGGGNRGGGRR